MSTSQLALPARWGAGGSVVPYIHLSTHSTLPSVPFSKTIVFYYKGGANNILYCAQKKRRQSVIWRVSSVRPPQHTNTNTAFVGQSSSSSPSSMSFSNQMIWVFAINGEPEPTPNRLLLLLLLLTHCRASAVVAAPRLLLAHLSLQRQRHNRCCCDTVTRSTSIFHSAD